MSSIHPLASIDPSAELGEGVEVGPFTVIGPHVRIGARSVLHPHAVIMGHTRIAEECEVFPFACVGMQSQDLKFHGEETAIEVGARTTIRENVTINGGTGEGSRTVVGEDCHLMTGCHIAHNVKVGNGVVLTNLATLGGEVVVEDGAVVGGLSGVHQFCRIGRMAYVGAHSKVTQDIPPYMLCDGHPAVVRTINKVGMQRRGITSETMILIQRAFRLLYRSGLSVPSATSKIEEQYAGIPEIETLLDFIRASSRGISR